MLPQGLASSGGCALVTHWVRSGQLFLLQFREVVLHVHLFLHSFMFISKACGNLEAFFSSAIETVQTCPCSASVSISPDDLCRVLRDVSILQGAPGSFCHVIGSDWPGRCQQQLWGSRGYFCFVYCCKPKHLAPFCSHNGWPINICWMNFWRSTRELSFHLTLPHDDS